MPPARTASPPYTLTPRYCALEPRPLRVEPPPFLCAIALARHSGDLHGREILAVASLAARALTLAELEDDELGAGALLHDLALDCRAGYLRGAEVRGVGAAHQHVVELNFVAGVASQKLHLNGVARGNSVLLSASADNCVGHGSVGGGT